MINKTLCAIVAATFAAGPVTFARDRHDVEEKQTLREAIEFERRKAEAGQRQARAERRADRTGAQRQNAAERQSADREKQSQPKQK